VPEPAPGNFGAGGAAAGAAETTVGVAGVWVGAFGVVAGPGRGGKERARAGADERGSSGAGGCGALGWPLSRPRP
jgi:hypothetical protein